MTRKIFSGEKFGKIKITSEINRLRCQQSPQARKKWIFTKIPLFLGPFFTFDPKIFAGHSQLVVVQLVDGDGGCLSTQSTPLATGLQWCSYGAIQDEASYSRKSLLKSDITEAGEGWYCSGSKNFS